MTALTETARQALMSARRWAGFLAAFCLAFALLLIYSYGFTTAGVIGAGVILPPGFFLGRFARDAGAYFAEGDRAHLAAACAAHRRLWIYVVVMGGLIVLPIGAGIILFFAR